MKFTILVFITFFLKLIDSRAYAQQAYWQQQLRFKNYFNKWKFKHPQPEDMQAAFEEAIGAKLYQFFSLTKKEGKLN